MKSISETEPNSNDSTAEFSEAETAKAEEGTLIYIFHHDAADANVVWFFETFANQDAFNAHMSTDAFKAFSASLAPFVDGAPEFHILTPIGGKGA